MSIIIVGVGEASFKTMIQLDSDDNLLSVENLTAARDIVQFVPFNEIASQGPEALAREVLAEIPSQVLQYCDLKH
jgi:hypothetical protein